MNANTTQADHEKTRTLLLNIIHAVVGNSHVYDDLLQEALIHLSDEECKHPGQSQSWYLQSCRHHILHKLHQGSSVDSPKRRHQQSVAVDQLGLTDCIDARFAIEATPVDFANAHDMSRGLNRKLSRTQLMILNFLMDGLTIEETAKELRISHQAVSKHRHRIAALAIALGE